MCAPQRGHADAGATTDTFRGVRETTTVKKDPKISPASANMGTRNAVMPSTVPRPSDGGLRVPDFPQVGHRRLVADLRCTREQGRGVGERHLVRNVHGPTEDLTLQAVLVRHVGAALRVDADLQTIVEVGVVREADVV